MTMNDKNLHNFFLHRFIFGCLWVLITFLECCFFVYQRVYTYRDSTLGLVKIHKKGIYVLLLLPLCILFVCSMVTLLVIRRCPYIQILIIFMKLQKLQPHFTTLLSIFQKKNISISSQVKQQFEITLKTDDPVKYIRNVVNIL